MNPFSIFPPRASSAAGEIDALFGFLTVVSVVMTVLIFFFVAFFAIKYRRKTVMDPVPKAVHGSLALEIAWSVGPFLLMLVMFVWGTKLYVQNYSPPPANTLDIYIVGKQWMWKAQHPGGQREINELHVPTGRAIKLTLASEDVVHSFYVPAFRLKHDVVPGSYQTFWFEATQEGRYRLFCAEYCGSHHADMGGWVTVMSPGAYQNWLSGDGQTTVTMEQRGAQLFQRYGCAGCHVQDTQGRCPSLRFVAGRPVQLDNGSTVIADEGYLRESIVNPNAKVVKGYPHDVMPVFQGQIGEEDLLQLIAYLKSLALPPSETGEQKQ